MSKLRKDKNDKDTIVDVEEVYSKTERYVEDNKKPILVITGIIVLIFIGYFAYTRLYLEPRNQEGSELLWKAEYYFEQDSLDKAINGDESYFGFAYVADEYGDTKAGNLAHYYLGLIYMEKGEWQTALDHLNNADLEDEVIGAMVKGNRGDVYAELGDYQQAMESYESAIEHSNNNLTAPIYLKKAALLHEQLGQNAEALENYRRIEEDFPNSNEARDIEYYIGRLGG